MISRRLFRPRFGHDISFELFSPLPRPHLQLSLTLESQSFLNESDTLKVTEGMEREDALLLLPQPLTPSMPSMRAAHGR